MRTELTELSATQKQLAFEIPVETVGAALDRVTRDYTKSARLPGFRPGKAPLTVVRKRYKDQILQDVMHDLIPQSLDEAMKERSLDPVDTPDIRDVSIEEGAPLRFTAVFETVPPLPDLDYASIQLRKTAIAVEDQAVASMLERMRERSARFEPVTDRPSEAGDTLTLDVTRTTLSSPGTDAAEAGDRTQTQTDTSVEIGAASNPPGFDAHVTGLTGGDTRTFTIRFPEDFVHEGLRGSQVQYDIAVKHVRRKILPALDDELARDLGLESLEDLRQRVLTDLVKDAERTRQREMRDALLRQLAAVVTVDVPQVLIDREVDRRLEEFVRTLVDQGVDPMKVGIDWEQFRARQRDAAGDTVKATLMLDEVARRESITVPAEAVQAELQRFADLSGRTVEAVRARLSQDGGMGRLVGGMRRDRVVEFLMARATILEV
jgi:trigger factor